MMEVKTADLHAACDADAVLKVLNAYSSDPNGLGTPLPEDVKQNLLPRMSALSNCRVFLAFCDGQPVGAAICFTGFSTFKAKETVNIHDLAVLPEYRNRGVGSVLLNAVEDFARMLGACKVTLEVRESNQAAERLYRRKGFNNPNGDCERTLFLERHLIEAKAFI